MLRLYHGKISKVVSPRFTTLNWERGGDEVCSVNVHQLSNLDWIGLKGYVQDCSKKPRNFRKEPFNSGKIPKFSCKML